MLEYYINLSMIFFFGREFLEREIQNSTKASLDRLFELWNMIGIKSLRENRVNAVLGHVANIYKTMIDEEEVNLDKITKSIGKYDRERKELFKDLGNNFVVDAQEETMTLVDVEFKLRNEVIKLREKKSQRMQVYNDIREAEKILCESTGSLPLNLIIDRMPTDGHVKQIEKYIVQLKVLFKLTFQLPDYIFRLVVDRVFKSRVLEVALYNESNAS